MEGQVGNGVYVLPLHQLGFLVHIGRLLRRQLVLDLLRGIGQAVQHFDGPVVVIFRSLQFRLSQQLLVSRSCCIRLLLGGNGGLLRLLILDFLILEAIGNGTDHKGEDEDYRDACNDGRQIGLLEDLGLGGPSSSAAAAVFIHVFRLRGVAPVEGLHIPIQELGEEAGLPGLPTLLCLPLPACIGLLGEEIGEGFFQVQLLLVLPGTGLIHRLAGCIGIHVPVVFAALFGGIILWIVGLGVVVFGIVVLRLSAFGVMRSLVVALAVVPAAALGEKQVLAQVFALAVVRVLPLLRGLVRRIWLEITLAAELLLVHIIVLEVLLIGRCILAQQLRQVQIILIKLRHIKIPGIVTAQELVRVKAQVLRKIKIDIKIVLIHGKSLPYGIVNDILSSLPKKSKPH